MSSTEPSTQPVTPPSTIHACVDVALPLTEQAQAAEQAAAENPRNQPTVSPRDLPPGVAMDPAMIAILTGKMWKPGRTLKVRFLDGDTQVQETLMPYAHEWTKHANIKFEFGDDPNAEIRISFKDAGSWSYLGTDCLGIAGNKPTMNFGWLTRSSAPSEYSRVVTHEFGHALALIHEHQNPAAEIPWNRDVVYAYYGGSPNFWTRTQVEVNLFRTYAREQTQFSDFDTGSIMLYPIPKEFVTDPAFEVGWNRELSATDKEYIARLYPYPKPAPNQLAIDGPALTASIGAFGEEDSFVLDVPRGGRYRIETRGRTDTLMSLWGPNNETELVARDDDSGQGLNALIERDLAAGRYAVRVRHFSAKRLGDYEIAALKA